MTRIEKLRRRFLSLRVRLFGYTRREKLWRDNVNREFLKCIVPYEPPSSTFKMDVAYGVKRIDPNG